MKRKLFVIAFALVAVIGTAVAAFLPVLTPHYVYSSSTPGGTLTNVGSFDITNTGTFNVQVRVFDISQNATVVRQAFDINGNALKNTSATTFNSAVQVP